MKPYWSSEKFGLEIYLGNSPEVVAALGREFDLCLTDIPYQISQDGNGLRELHYGEWDTGGDPVGDMLDIVETYVTGTAAIFCHETQLSFLINGMEECGFSTRSWVWHKPNPTVMNGKVMPLPSVELAAWGKRPGAYFGGHCRHNFSEYPVVVGDERVHPTQKPLSLMSTLCELSCAPTGVVIDPFLGSGTTIVACYNLGRKCVGIEISEEYCELAAERIEKETLQQRLFEPIDIETKQSRTPKLFVSPEQYDYIKANCDEGEKDNGAN